RRHQYLVVAAASVVDLAAGIAQAFGQARLDRGMSILEALVEHERAGAEIRSQLRQFALQARQLVVRQDADALQPFGVGSAGTDVVQEELAVQDHVVAGEEALDIRIHRHAGLLPEQSAHRPSSAGSSASPGTPANSSKPSARLRFCSAWVAAPLSRLSGVATTPTRLPRGAAVNPPISAPWQPAMRLTQGASSSTRSSSSPA